MGLKFMNKLCGLALVSLVAACGGGTDEGGLVPPGINVPDDELLTWEKDFYYPSYHYKDQCESPREGFDPFSNTAYPDKPGAYYDENFWLRSWVHELYLWSDEVVDVDPFAYNTADYFEELKTNETTPAGYAKDNFHFIEDTFEYRNSTVGGVSFGYGIKYAFVQSSPPREIRVVDIIPGSVADTEGVQRGMLITAIDGADMVDGNDVDTLNNGLYPRELNESHIFEFLPVGGGATLTASLRSQEIADPPVKYVTSVQTETGEVGYMHFNAHNYPSEAALFDAFTSLQGVSDLVLDLRYNGGGLLAVAGEVGFMVAGNANTANRVFYLQQFNEKHGNTNPVTGQTISATPFFSNSLGFDESLLAGGRSLPSLNLSRVYILAGGGTCSASEAIINGLLGIGVEVYLIGSTTCGKPYGFYPQDNCGSTYFSIQFTGVNDLGVGEYSDGFSPANEPNARGISVPGCYVEDDYSKLLGDSEEGMFAAALQLRETGTCPSVTVSPKPQNVRQKTFMEQELESRLEIKEKAYRTNMVIE